jgi:1-acyl-sn-glycerol-3-phosphate acyltransferase
MIRSIRIAGSIGMAALGTAVLAPAQWVLMRTGYRGNRILRTWHRVVASALGLRIHVVGAPADGRPLLLASNHVSWLDITVLGSSAELAFIAKAEMSGWPLMGWLSRLQRTVFVERERRRKSGVQASEIGDRLGSGDAMVLFAEGTTSDGTAILPFKSTLFGAAGMVLAGGRHETVWIQPVALVYLRVQGLPMGRRGRAAAAWIGDQDLLPHIKGVLRAGALDVEVRFGEPLPFRIGDDRKAMARVVEREVRLLFSQSLSQHR